MHGSGGDDGEGAQRHDDADAPEKHGDGLVVRKDLPLRSSPGNPSGARFDSRGPSAWQAVS